MIVLSLDFLVELSAIYKKRIGKYRIWNALYKLDSCKKEDFMACVQNVGHEMIQAYDFPIGAGQSRLDEQYGEWMDLYYALQENEKKKKENFNLYDKKGVKREYEKKNSCFISKGAKKREKGRCQYNAGKQQHSFRQGNRWEKRK